MCWILLVYSASMEFKPKKWKTRNVTVRLVRWPSSEYGNICKQNVFPPKKKSTFLRGKGTFLSFVEIAVPSDPWRIYFSNCSFFFFLLNFLFFFVKLETFLCKVFVFVKIAAFPKANWLSQKKKITSVFFSIKDCNFLL